MSQAITILATGDVAPNRPDPFEAFDLVRDLLRSADITFGQQEVVLSERGENVRRYMPPSESRTHPRAAQAIAEAGFDVMSFASNHALNHGEDAFNDTIEALRQNGLTVIGVGQDLEEARRPAVVVRGDTRVGFLAYCSVVPTGDDATRDRCGVAPMRATAYFIDDTPWQPGRPPRVMTVPRPDELAAMVRDISAVKADVDVLIVSMHWGASGTPAGLIAQYQYDVGRAAIDAGADVIVGHHPHVIKGVEMYRGKPIFYCVGNLLMDEPVDHIQRSVTYRLTPWPIDPAYPTYPFPPEFRMGVIVKCVVEDKHVARTSVLPTLINQQGQPEPLAGSDPRSAEVLAFIQAASQDQGFTTRFVATGDEIEVR
jgi:hypothetical protein